MNLTFEFSGEALKNFHVFTGKLPWWRLLFDEAADSEFIRAIYYKKDSITEVFSNELTRRYLFLEFFLRDIFAIHFLRKLQASDL